MTFQEAMSALEKLLEVEEFSFRSGGGDGAIIRASIDALDYLSKMQPVGEVVSKLEEEAVNTGRAEPVVKAFEVLKYELLLMFVEGVLLFAPVYPSMSEARDLAERLIPHLREVRKLLEPYYDQEVE